MPRKYLYIFMPLVIHREMIGMAKKLITLLISNKKSLHTSRTGLEYADADELVYLNLNQEMHI